jgi:hypothetical protein
LACCRSCKSRSAEAGSSRGREQQRQGAAEAGSSRGREQQRQGAAEAGSSRAGIEGVSERRGKERRERRQYL